MQGVFNKEAMIRKILAEYSPEEATWIWWVDIDTAMVNMALPLPLHHYDGYDLVAWGRKVHILEGHMNDGEWMFAAETMLSFTTNTLNKQIIDIRQAPWGCATYSASECC